MTEMPRRPTPDDDRDPLKVWVIYENPTDFPEGYVVRIWWVRAGVVQPNAWGYAFNEIERARRAIPPGLRKFERCPYDDPAIKEVWL